ncbi:hypothetical protein DH2020_021240 [Rehmannia glutinosa]|uniref:DUF7895 domain-containing protein n=1 Tax=Rehmannia glutinosa TaxID=99300 RepID=A0ABR0WE67_REHGL
MGSLSASKAKSQRGEAVRIVCALPETAASIVVAATVVGAAATFLRRRTKSSEVTEAPTKTCEDCGGSGVCSECNGEGFVLKRLSEGSAEKARLMAKIWQLDTQPGFQRSGATAQSAPLLDLVLHAVAVGNSAT